MSSNTAKIRRVAVRNPLDMPIAVVASRLGGSKSKEVERFIKFAIVGAVGAIIDFGTLFILQATVIPPLDPNKDLKVALASTIAFLAAVVSNFVWNRLWTYPDSRSRSMRRQLAQFTTISAIGWLGRTLWISTAYKFLGEALMPVVLPEIQLFRPGYVPSESAEAKLGTLVAWCIGVVVVMVWNFLANRYWTYNDVKSHGHHAESQS
ncbi:GtrA family protein [Kamptonema cortianum]|jgi:putative flippase GtrA|nr:GtrA family protein [Kamptonema cortianum]